MPSDGSKLIDQLHQCHHFQHLSELCADKQAYVVGGAIRDALLDTPITDIDLVFPRDSTSLAKRFARQAGGSWFWLDQSRRQSRVVFGQTDSSMHYDFAPFRAADIDGDLEDRDFTINAMAIDLDSSTVLDPFNGRKDLRANCLRMVRADSLSNDPLRILKGVRHATLLDLQIDPETLNSMRKSAGQIELVAVERTRQEIWKILASNHVSRGLVLLNEAGAGQVLFGEDFELSLNSLVMSVAEYEKRWQSLVNANPSVSQWLAHEAENGLKIKTLLLFVLLLQHVDRALPEYIAKRWLLGRKARGIVSGLARLDMPLYDEFASVARNPRALYWWSHEKRVDARSLLLFLLCSNLPDESIVSDIKGWLPIAERVEQDRLPDLVYGRWLTKRLGIEEGPEMSKAFQLLRRAEILGEVTNENDARNYLSRYYLDSD